MKSAIYIFGLFLLTSCGRGYELSELYIQEIETSDKTIIEYGAWSTLNDGAKYGTTILKKNESIDIRDAEQMSFSFLIGKPTKDTLFVIGLKEGGKRIPKYISTEISKLKGMIIKTDLYSYEIGTSHNLTYKFSSFRETRDSLIISGIEKDYFNLPTEKNEIGFSEEDYNKCLIDFKISWTLFEEFCKANNIKMLWSTWDELDNYNFKIMGTGENYLEITDQEKMNKYFENYISKKIKIGNIYSSLIITIFYIF
jgi:hypothetical protein